MLLLLLLLLPLFDAAYGTAVLFWRLAVLRGDDCHLVICIQLCFDASDCCFGVTGLGCFLVSLLLLDAHRLVVVVLLLMLRSP